jgi:serine/threonine protein kinase
LRREVEALLSSDGSACTCIQVAVHSELRDFGFSMAGEVVSHYRILDGLGGGGMGLVYRAEDIRLGRQVALKFLPEESVKDPASLTRFEREARAASALEHPNICPIYEFGEHEGRPFLVMQLLEGQTLRELLETESESSKSGSQARRQNRHPLPLDQVLDLGVQIANGLEAAHQKGIIHRDIKPANIFVTIQGQAKILDFGLAKLAHGATEEGDGSKHEDRDSTSDRAAREAASVVTPDIFLSRTGVAMGTAGYMSPEQARGERLDARTDLFSFGLVLYEMATGHRAFEGETGPALHNAILTQSPLPARQLNPEVSVKLEAIIYRALQKNLAARYQSVVEMRADLEGLKRDMESKYFRRWPVALGACAALLIAATILWLARRPPSSAQALPDLKLRQLTVNSPENLVTGGAISPDGKFLAYTDQKGMHIKSIGTDEAQTIPQPEGFQNDKVKWEIAPTAWFPDNTRFVANAHPAAESPSDWSSQTSSIWVVSVAGGAPRKLHDHAIAWSVSPDASLISFGTHFGELWLMGPNGERAHKLYEVGDKNAMCCLYFFPSGQRVSYISTDESGDSLVARDLKGGPVTTLLPSSELKKMGDASWLPDGRFALAGLDNFLWSPRFSFAWQPLGVSRNTVLRGGIGIFYDPLRDASAEAFYTNTPIYNVYTAFSGNLTPDETSSLFYETAFSNEVFVNGFAAGKTLAQMQAADPNFLPPSINSVARTIHLPQYQRWSLEWQQAFSLNTSATIGYFGHHGIHEGIVNPSANAFGFGSLPRGQCPSPPVAPCSDPRFSQVAQYGSDALSNYNGLIVSFQRQFSRFGNGLIQLNYTYSHALDEVSNAGFFSFTSGSSLYPQDPNNLRGAYGSAEYDVRHSLNGNYVWEVPVKRALRDHGPDYLVKGWQFSGTIFARTGFPYSVFDNFQSGVLKQNNYFSQIYSVPVGPLPAGSSCGKDAAFTIDAHACLPPQFSVLADGTSQPNPNALCVQAGCETGFNTGHLPGPSGPCSGPAVSLAQGRNRFRGPGYFNTDLAVMKNTKIPGWENATLGIGFQFFNLFNHPNFGLPDNLSSDPTFAQIFYLQQTPTGILGSGLGGDAEPRMIQLKAQLRF